MNKGLALPKKPTQKQPPKAHNRRDKACLVSPPKGQHKNNCQEDWLSRKQTKSGFVEERFITSPHPTLSLRRGLKALPCWGGLGEEVLNQWLLMHYYFFKAALLKSVLLSPLTQPSPFGEGFKPSLAGRLHGCRR